MDNIEDKLKEKAEENLKKDDSLKTEITMRDRLKAVLPVLSAVTVGKEISLERREKRLLICSECDKLSLINGKIGCGVCGCRLKVENNERSIVNLISYEETDKYGCKHPTGSKWKANGV